MINLWCGTSYAIWFDPISPLYNSVEHQAMVSVTSTDWHTIRFKWHKSIKTYGYSNFSWECYLLLIIVGRGHWTPVSLNACHFVNNLELTYTKTKQYGNSQSPMYWKPYPIYIDSAYSIQSRLFTSNIPQCWQIIL